MGLWPFGREPADVESASRVVTAPTRDSRRVRGKLTLYFKEPQTQAVADAAADRSAQIAEALFRDVPGHEQLLGNEERLSSALAQRLPADLPATRAVELAALHVVGDVGSIARRRPSSLIPPAGDVPPASATFPPSSTPYPPPSASYLVSGGVHPTPPAGYVAPVAVYPPPPSSPHGAPLAPLLARRASSVPPPASTPYRPSSAPPASGPVRPTSGSVHPSYSPHPSSSSPYPPAGLGFPPAAAPSSPGTLRPPGSVTPGPAQVLTGSVRPPPSSMTPRRRTTSSIRALSSSIVPPRGSPPADIGASLWPLFRDASTRLLLGFLRTHDLVMVRHVALDETATELLAALLPVSEAPPGEFEASRAAEIGRWRGALGNDAVEALRAEASVLAASLAELALERVGMVPSTAIELLDALCKASAPPGTTLAPDARYTEDAILAEAACSVARLLEHPDPGPIEIALAPLLAAVSDDMDVLAQIAKVALGFPA